MFVRHLAIDLTLAAGSNVPVLISGPPHRTVAFARLIAARRAGGGGGAGLRVCDVTRGDDIFTAMEGPDSAEPAGSVLSEPLALRQAQSERRLEGTVVFREVQNLSDPEQAVLADLIADQQVSDDMPMRRVVATSCISLFHRVRQGTFDDRLFYLLNAIHIDVRPGRAFEPADRVGLLWLPSSNELSRERFSRISPLGGGSSLLASIIDILAATPKRR